MTDEEVAAALSRWLVGQGFEYERVEDSISADGVEELRRARLRVRLVRERGGWFVDVESPTRGRWYDADVWRRCLEDTPIDDHPGFQEQARFVMRSLDRVTQAHGEPGIEHCLKRRARDRVAQRLGLVL